MESWWVSISSVTYTLRPPTPHPHPLPPTRTTPGLLSTPTKTGVLVPAYLFLLVCFSASFSCLVLTRQCLVASGMAPKVSLKPQYEVTVLTVAYQCVCVCVRACVSVCVCVCVWVGVGGWMGRCCFVYRVGGTANRPVQCHDSDCSDFCDPHSLFPYHFQCSQALCEAGEQCQPW